ncbi:chemotaxis protein CheW [Chitinimonas sp.]|uniref:chemotaxis protein CheW n=1 Tax=Chitinimonas sp. TaxID=1934313 RepID=UPI002F93F30A
MATVYSVLPFDLHGQCFALPAQQVVRVLPALLTLPLPAAPRAVAGLCNVHGRLLPVLDIRAHFGWPAAEPRRWDHWIWARTGRRELLLPVSRCHPVCELEADFYPVDELHIPGRLLQGVLRSEAGVLLLKDLETFLTAAEDAALGEAMADHVVV